MSMETKIGCPYVIISKVPIKDPHNPEDSEFILLKTEDGTLLSFREAFADGAGGNNTGVTIELFDPDHLFLMQFIDNNMVKGFEVMAENAEGLQAIQRSYRHVNRLIDKAEVIRGGIASRQKTIDDVDAKHKRISDQLEEEDAGWWARHNARAERLGETQNLGSSGRKYYDAKVYIKDQTPKLEELEKRIEEANKSHEINNHFYITYGIGTDPINQSPSRLFTFTELEFLHDSSKQGGMRLKFSHNLSENQNAALAAEKRRTEPFRETGQRRSFGDAVIVRTKSRLNKQGEIIFDDTPDYPNLMEYTLQKFLRDTSPSESTPLVFLSPEVLPRMRAVIKEMRNLNPIKGVALERQGPSAPTLLGFSKFVAEYELLESFGFKVAISETYYAGHTTFGPTRRGEQTYTLQITNNKKQTSIEQVVEIINNIYKELGITIGDEIVSRPLIEGEHVEYFLNNFLDGDGSLRNSILKTKREGKSYANTLAIKPGDPNSLLLIGDGLFINGVIFNLPYEENEEIHASFKNALPGSNIYRFVNNINYSGYKKVIKRIYVDPGRVKGMFNLPDEYALKLPDEISNLLSKKVPTFLSNVEHSNVISFVATHKKQEQSEIMSKLSVMFTHRFFESVKTLEGKKILKPNSGGISKSDMNRILEDMVNHEYENSAGISSLMKYIKKGWDAKNSASSKAYESIIDGFVENQLQSKLVDNHKISVHAVRTYMLYMQTLSFRYSAVKAKTTSMFHICPEFWVSKPSLFLNKKLHSPNSTFFINRESPFSGMYLMLGFEHVITASECFSSFSLHRVPFATSEIENTEVKK